MLPALPSLLTRTDAFIVISPFAVVAVGGLLLAIFGIITILLQYHWKHYAISQAEVMKIAFWYYAGGAVVAGGMALSGLAYILLSR